MFFKTAYETTACMGYKLEKTIDTLKAAYYNDDVIPIEKYNIYSLNGGTPISNNVPSFAHPLLVNFDNKDEMLIVDSRNYGRFISEQNIFKVQNQTDYNLMLARAKLNYIWVNNKPNWLRDISTIPLSIFSSWISEAVGKRFALNPKEQFDLGILAAIFYLSLFSDDVELEEKDKLRLINIITRSLHASAQDVITILDKVSVISNIFEFCSNAEKVTDSVRLRELNPGLLYTILGGTWFGTNAKEMIAVSIEHPPTWIAIMISAFTDRTFKNSQIVKITERTAYKKVGDDFIRSVLNTLRMAEKD